MIYEPMLGEKGFDVRVCAALVALIWITRFWHAAQFGFYEDDYFLVAWGFGMDSRGVWETVKDSFTRSVHARPVGWSMQMVVSLLAYNAGGVVAIYGAAAAMVAANAIAFYLLMKRISNDAQFAVAASVAFCLFPADTTQAFLTHIFLQFSLLLVLLSLHAYLAGHAWVARGLAGLTLVCYESVYLLSLAAPVLDPGWNRGQWRRALKHAAWLLAILFVYAGVRMQTGESRVAGINAAAAAWLSLRNVVTGSANAVAMYIVRPVDVLAAMDGELWLWCGVAAALIWWVLSRGGASGAPLFPLAWRGLLMLPLAYPFTVILNGADTAGRGSRVHMAAAPGAAMLVGGACVLLLRRQQGRWAAVAVAVALSLLTGFGHTVQHGYASAWEEQKELWSSVDRLCRDVGDGTVIIVDPGPEPEPPRAIKAVGWSVGLALLKIFQFPADWKEAPLAERSRNLVVKDGGVGVQVVHGGLIRMLPAGNTIVLEYREGRWARRDGELEFGGVRLALKQRVRGAGTPLGRGFLYREVFGR